MDKKMNNEELQSRREFFKKAAKSALPMIAAVALASAPAIVNAAEKEMGCNWACEGYCTGNCTNSCTGRCSGCMGTCTGTCSGTCSGSCAGSCSYGCVNTTRMAG